MIAIERQNIHVIASQVFFTALFPGMFFYHYFAALRLYPLFLSGWWGAVTALAALFFLPSFITARARPEFLAFAALTSIVCIYAGYHAVYGAEWQRSSELLINSVALILAWCGLYGVGLAFRPGRHFTVAMIALLVIMAGATFISMDFRRVSFIAVERFRAPDGVADYQWFALSFVIVAIYCLSAVRGWRQTGVAALSLGVLYVLSSRSELFGFAAVLGIWGLRLAVERRFLQLAMVPITVLVAFGAILVGSAWLSQLPLQAQIDAVSVQIEAEHATEAPQASGPIAVNPRQEELLDISNSESLEQRLHFLELGLSDIAASPILGVYGGQVRNGEFGTYIHNGLDMWRQFGLMAFAIFCGLTIYCVIVSGRRVLSSAPGSSSWMFPGYISFFSLVLVVATKGIFWPIPALAWGLVVGMNIRERAGRQQSIPSNSMPTTAK